MRRRLLGVGLAGAGVAGLTWAGVFKPLLSANYLPHRFCYLAQPGLIWTNVVADGLIAGSYAVLCGCLMWIGSKLRSEASFKGYLWIVISFGVFILACGMTHGMEVVTVWWPVYPLSAAVKVVCAAASVGTAALFCRATPALATNLHHFVEMLTATERERDQAVSALSVWEKLVEERQAAAKEISTVYARLNGVLEGTSDMVMTLARDWTVMYGNGKALARLPDLKVGTSYWTCFPGIEGTFVEGYLRTTMEERTPAQFENYYAPYDRWYKVQIYPSEEGLSMFFSDATEERRIRDALEQEQLMREKRIEALSHMAGGLAHEISNPLAIIHARASDLMAAAAAKRALATEAEAARASLAEEVVLAKAAVRKEATAARITLAREATASKADAESVDTADFLAGIPAGEVLEVCESIVNTSERAIRILRGLRGFGREASQDPKEWGSMHDIVEECVEIQASRYERHGVWLKVALEEDLPLVMCRATQIGQIVTNLLNNAFDAIDQGQCEERWVKLTGTKCQGGVCVDVEDSGTGIPEEIRPRLMEAFFTTKKMGLGMGVGLSLSRSIAQDHGGSLNLLPDTQHTCFRLVLPIGSEA